MLLFLLFFIFNFIVCLFWFYSFFFLIVISKLKVVKFYNQNSMIVKLLFMINYEHRFILSKTIVIKKSKEMDDNIITNFYSEFQTDLRYSNMM